MESVWKPTTIYVGKIRRFLCDLIIIVESKLNLLNMKKLFILVSTVFILFENSKAQEFNGFSLKPSFGILTSESLSYDFYNKATGNEGYDLNNVGIYEDYSYSLNIYKNTKWENLQIFAGGNLLNGSNKTDGKVKSLSVNGQTVIPTQWNSFQSHISGGGVYLGIRPHLEYKFIGLYAELAVGIMNYKEDFFIVHDLNNENVFIKEVYSSNGLGSRGELGAYLAFGRFKAEAGYQFISSGGKSGSFLFQGFNFGLGFSIKPKEKK
jgi:hypothetical protein